MRFRRTIFSLLAFVLLASVLASLVIQFWDRLPYQSLAERQIRTALKPYGLEVERLTVERLDTRRAILKDIALGKNGELTIGLVEAEYTPEELRRGRLRRLLIHDMRAQLRQENGAWVIAGLEPVFTAAAPAEKSNALPPLPFDQAALRALLPESIEVRNAVLSVSGTGVTGAASFDATLLMTGTPLLKLRIGELSAGVPPYGVSLGEVDIAAALNEKPACWEGTLASPSLTVSGLPQKFPLLGVGAKFRLQPESLTASLGINEVTSRRSQLAKPLGALNASFPGLRLLAENVSLSFGGGAARIGALRVPYAGGAVTAKSLRIPFALDAPIVFPLTLERIDLSTLLKETAGEKISGTGRLSGTLPVTYHPDGHIGIGAGTLSAEDPGTLSLSPQSIPGEGRAELEQVRAALQNFHYSKLLLRVLSDQQGRPQLKLEVEGNSPDAFGGKPVKLNVNLTGDLLPLVRQSLLPLNDAKHWLRESDSPGNDH